MAVSFPIWKEALSVASLPTETQMGYRREILAFLHHCKVKRAPATIMLAKEYLAAQERQGANGARPALRWFFQAARKQLGAASSMPAVVAPGRGGAPAEAPAVAGGIAVEAASPREYDRRGRAGEPPAAATDQGGADWERDLIKATRSAGFLWRTEETYRGWAA